MSVVANQTLSELGATPTLACPTHSLSMEIQSVGLRYNHFTLYRVSVIPKADAPPESGVLTRARLTPFRNRIIAGAKIPSTRQVSGYRKALDAPR